MFKTLHALKCPPFQSDMNDITLPIHFSLTFHNESPSVDSLWTTIDTYSAVRLLHQRVKSAANQLDDFSDMSEIDRQSKATS